MPLPEAGLGALLDTIQMMDTDAPQRPPLLALTAALRTEAGGRSAHCPDVLASAVTYSESLMQAAQWHLAIDVYRTVISHATTSEERRILPSVYMGLATCLAKLGRWNAAFESIHLGRSQAFINGDVFSERSLQIAESKLEAERGSSS